MWRLWRAGPRYVANKTGFLLECLEGRADEVENAPLVPPPAAPLVPPPAARAGRCRLRGPQSASHVAQRMASRRVKELEKARAAVQLLEEVLQPTLVSRVSTVTFGCAQLPSGSFLGERIELPSRSNADYEKQVLRDRGLLSHVRAQARGLCSFLRDDGDVECAFVTKMFDDASMWVRQPEARKRAGESLAAQAERRKVARREQNVSLPVLNVDQTVHVLRRSGGAHSSSVLRTAEVHCPAQVLPAGTVYI
jgi:hypothetical protein